MPRWTYSRMLDSAQDLSAAERRDVERRMVAHLLGKWRNSVLLGAAGFGIILMVVLLGPRIGGRLLETAE